MSGQIRVVHVGPDPTGRGGMAAVIRNTLSSPLAVRFPLDSVVTYRTSAPVRRAMIFAVAVVRLAAWCSASGPRIVHVHAAVRGSLYRKAVCVLVARAFRRPVLLHVHAGAPDIEAFVVGLGRRQRFFQRIFLAADRVLTVSEAGAEALEALFAVREVIVVPNAAPPASRERGRAHSKPTGRPRILYLGGFEDPAKGGRILLAALPSIVRALPGADITLAGPGDLPPEGDSLLRHLEPVRWVGWLDGPAKAAMLSGTDIVVLPSLSEGLPLALLEAMAEARAVVATRVGGIPDVLTDGANALLVPPDDPEGLAEALRRLAGDPDLRTRLGSAALERAMRLNEDEVGAVLERIYLSLP